MAWKRIARFVVPIFGGRKSKEYKLPAKDLSPSFYIEAKKQSDPFAVVKPATRLGGSWIDDYISRRKNFNLCDFCQPKYDKDGFFWKRYEYVVSKCNFLTDCDGCKAWALCKGYYPESNAKLVLIDSLWRR